MQVFFYSNMIFERAGFTDPDSQNYASVGVGGFNVLMTFVSVNNYFFFFIIFGTTLYSFLQTRYCRLGPQSIEIFDKEVKNENVTAKILQNVISYF